MNVYMDAEIIVKKTKIKGAMGTLWKVVSNHAECLNLLTRRKTLDSVDLLCLTDLGFKIKYKNK